MALRRQSPLGSRWKRASSSPPSPVLDLPPMRFMAMARVSWASLEIEPKDMAPVAKRLTQEAMEKELHGLSVQPVPFADFGQPLLDLLGELASHADSGGLRTPAPLPRVEADPRPYLEYLRNDTAFIEIRGLRLNVAEAPRFPIDDLYIPLVDEMGSGREAEGGRARQTLAGVYGEPERRTPNR